jgi:aminoglycoside phosphotransferase
LADVVEGSEETLSGGAINAGVSDPQARAAAVLTRLGRPGTPVRVEHGESNHVWFAGDVVIRISAAPGDGHLLGEAALARVLPAAVGYPTVLGCGVEGGHEWMATERIDGDNLGQIWPDLTSAEQARAVEDLYTRLDAVHRTDLDAVDDSHQTPFYALTPARATRQLRWRDVLDPAPARRLAAILDDGFAAVAAAPRALVHTDAGPGNTVWDGQRAIPVDFEFACVGPADLDVENLGRSLWQQPELLARLATLAQPVLATTGAYERLLCYAVLRDLWALGKWLAVSPDRTGIQDWQPMLALREHADGASWVARLFQIR